MTDPEIRELLGIQYGRDDVDYVTWYSDWSKQLAKIMTLEEIEKEMGVLVYDAQKASASHLRAIEASTSMHSQSQRRAQSRNVVRAVGERRMALSSAREIHYLFPEHGFSVRLMGEKGMAGKRLKRIWSGCQIVMMAGFFALALLADFHHSWAEGCWYLLVALFIEKDVNPRKVVINFRNVPPGTTITTGPSSDS